MPREQAGSCEERVLPAAIEQWINGRMASMELANGTEADGISYRVYLKSPTWVAEVTHPDGRTKTESWHWAWEPRCGPDVQDVNTCEEILERLIMELRKKH